MFVVIYGNTNVLNNIHMEHNIELDKIIMVLIRGSLLILEIAVLWRITSTACLRWHNRCGRAQEGPGGV